MKIQFAFQRAKTIPIVTRINIALAANVKQVYGFYADNDFYYIFTLASPKNILKSYFPKVALSMVWEGMEHQEEAVLKSSYVRPMEYVEKDVRC